jgi:hypothetical protein
MIWEGKYYALEVTYSIADCKTAGPHQLEACCVLIVGFIEGTGYSLRRGIDRTADNEANRNMPVSRNAQANTRMSFLLVICNTPSKARLSRATVLLDVLRLHPTL